VADDGRRAASADDRYREIVAAFLGLPGVTQEGRGFGSSALRVGGRIFAMLSSRGDFVVKLPRGASTSWSRRGKAIASTPAGAA